MLARLPATLLSTLVAITASARLPLNRLEDALRIRAGGNLPEEAPAAAPIVSALADGPPPLLYNATEAELAAKVVAAAYYRLIIPRGRDAQDCVDWGRLNLPEGVRVRVARQIDAEVGGSHVSATVATISPGQSGVPDIIVAFPGVAGDGASKRTQYLGIVTSFLFHRPALVRSLGEDGMDIDGHPVRVLSYFLDTFEALWPRVLAAVRELQQAQAAAGPLQGRLIVAGHSLGGSLADLASAHFAAVSGADAPGGTAQPVLYTYGGPRTGNFAFASLVDRSVSAAWRVVHGRDPIPHLPPCSRLLPFSACRSGHRSSRYHHGVEIWYPDADHQGAEEREGAEEEVGAAASSMGGYLVCGTDSDRECSNGLAVWQQTGIGQHVSYFGMPLSYQCLLHR